MKKLLLILLCLPLLFSCSKEDDETIQPNNTSALSIDVNLVGEWIYEESEFYYEYFIFGSNGEYCTNTISSNCGEWWSENDKIMFSYEVVNTNFNLVSTQHFQSDYSIDGNELTIAGVTFLKQ